MSTERLVALDIGTRSVIGLILEKSDTYQILGVIVEEHDHRTMFDGQIHDIPKVALTVSNVLKKLEELTGEKITEVAVAAAGRSLVTIKGNVKLEHELHQINEDEIIALELQAVQATQKDMLKTAKTNGSEYYCVGYTVLNYYLDESEIRNLTGQAGKTVEVEVIATFLPRVVVDSLLAVLEKCNLKIKSLTLEPIAASEVAIPEGMRQLNLALVDIGAGTSDIAITSNGRLTAYAMVPYAGDEITDKIAESYLLDFSTAEKVKRSLNRKEVKFKDILGNSHAKVSSAEIKQAINNATETVAQKISSAILDLNSKPPQAIICIGGGSLTPGIAEKIAFAIDLPTSRVGIAGRDTLQNIVGHNKNIFKKATVQQLITPLGIGLNSINSLGLTYCEVSVNKSAIRLLAIKDLSVADALIAANIDLKKLIGKPGKALTIEINGEVTFLRGQPGVPAKITLNENVVNVDAKISEGDKISFSPAQAGADCQVTLSDLKEMYTQHITVNGSKYLVKPRIYINEQVVNDEFQIKENSKLKIAPVKVKDVLHKGEYGFANLVQITLNNIAASLETHVKDGDEIKLVYQEVPQVQETFQVTINNREVNLNWDKKEQPILSDMLPHANIDLNTNLANKKLVILVNSKEAGFTTEIKNYDQIDLFWE